MAGACTCGACAASARRRRCFRKGVCYSHSAALRQQPWQRCDCSTDPVAVQCCRCYARPAAFMHWGEGGCSCGFFHHHHHLSTPSPLLSPLPPSLPFSRGSSTRPHRGAEVFPNFLRLRRTCGSLSLVCLIVALRHLRPCASPTPGPSESQWRSLPGFACCAPLGKQGTEVVPFDSGATSTAGPPNTVPSVPPLGTGRGSQHSVQSKHDPQARH